MAQLEKKNAPPFELEGSDGKKHSLRDYSGKKVVLYFYPKDNTPGCTKEACGFRDRNATLEKMGVVVLGISKDGIGPHKKFISDHKLPFVLLSDPELSVIKAYGAWGKKQMYGKAVAGTIRSTVIIDADGKVLKHWPAVKKADEHPAEVLEFLRAEE